MELSDYPLQLTLTTVNDMTNAQALTDVQRKDWAVWRLSIVERYISIDTGISIQIIGRPAWAIKNNKTLKLEGIRELVAQRKILKKYIKKYS